MYAYIFAGAYDWQKIVVVFYKFSAADLNMVTYFSASDILVPQAKFNTRSSFVILEALP